MKIKRIKSKEKIKQMYKKQVNIIPMKKYKHKNCKMYKML